VAPLRVVNAINPVLSLDGHAAISSNEAICRRAKLALLQLVATSHPMARINNNTSLIRIQIPLDTSEVTRKRSNWLRHIRGISVHNPLVIIPSTSRSSTAVSNPVRIVHASAQLLWGRPEIVDASLGNIWDFARALGTWVNA